MLGDRHDQGAQRRFGVSSAGAHERRQGSLARALAHGEARAALTFAGQGALWLPELTALVTTEPALMVLVEAAEKVLEGVAREREVRWSGLLDQGVALTRWVRGAAPDARYLASTPVSLPAIFLTQIARAESLSRRGLGAAFEAGGIVGATGYSQGIAAATFVAERRSPTGIEGRLGDYLRALAWLGFDVTRATRDATNAAGDTPMALVVGPDRAAVDEALAGVEGVVIGLVNDRRRHVLSGSPSGLARVQERLEKRAAREAEARKAGRHGGPVLSVAWEPIATTAAFHSPLVATGLERTLERVRALGFGVAPLLPVFDPGWAPGEPTTLGERRDPTAAMLQSIATRQGRWQEMLFRLESALGREAPLDALLDMGPGEGIARLCAGALRGLGVEAMALGGGDEERERFFSLPRLARPLRYADFEPRLAELPSGEVVVDNAFSRATGTPPVILPGMTPTTVDVPIVAAAANAGYTVELAGGGQVSEPILAERLKELATALAPGVEVVFNALLLDAYLWGLHLGDKRLVQKARAAGAPLSGVTVSAGIPPLEQAVKLLDELAALGMRTNAFKPGTRAQIEEVVAIARAARHHTIFIHIEGGRAGGHHSWEDLDHLLLETYHAIRSQPNLVLCVGGGIAHEQRAVELVLGTWAHRYGLPVMPVDAIFLGTLAMACQEATATASVKAALAAASGTAEAAAAERWVHKGEVKGGVTSGRSQLDADIHYLDNDAARCGRLLDEVAGDAAAVLRRRDEIILALGKTAKPYFGDVEAMTYHALLARMLELMAIGGASPRYEDGPWLDVTWRARFFDMLRRSEARLAGARDEREVESVVADLAALDAPEAVLAALVGRYPEARRERLHPVDATYFLREVCQRPGKPVPFVPVIDQDVRRHFKADSLWQAQHPRYRADEVLVIPGPEAVSGITNADEPVAALLGRFSRAILEAVRARGVAPRRADTLGARHGARAPGVWDASDAPAGVTSGGSAEHLVLCVHDAPAAQGWRGWIAQRHAGPLAALVGLDEAQGIFGGAGRLDNPVPRLLAPVFGATLTLRSDMVERVPLLTHVLYQPAEREWVSLDLVRTGEGDQVTLRLGWDERVTYALSLEVAHGAGLGGAGAHHRFFVADRADAEAVQAMYAKVLFASPRVPVVPFEVAHETAALPRELVRAYQHVTGRRRSDDLPALAQVFSLAWPAIFRTLSCEALAPGLLRLVHLDNRVVRLAPKAAWRGVESVAVAARVTRIEDHEDRRLVSVVADVGAGGVSLARLETSFHIRGRFAPALRSREDLAVGPIALDDAACAFIAGHPWIALERELVAGDGISIVGALTIERPTDRGGRYGARGELRVAGARVGTIDLDVAGDLAEHPLRALLAALGAEAGTERATPRRTLAMCEVRAPSDMHAFAEVGGDLNPIHTRLGAARLAGLPQPIVHGMWTAARLEAFVADELGAERLTEVTARFVAPLLPGERVKLALTRVGIERGATVVEATASALRDGQEQLVASARVALSPRPCAYVFPGQGIQQRDMGMAAFQRSPAARKVWERADAFTRRALGFSVLRVVRENPRELTALGRAGDASSLERLVHPQGVLNLTQVTQVAMAVLACAEVAELREAGVWNERALLAGHSVGEYNALAAGAEVLPLEAVIAIVYQRGRVMHGLVPRDADGESGFRMGVIRPHLAGLDHAGAEALVAELRARTGRVLEIVNYNVRGRQYSVTGHREALAALESALAQRQRSSDKPAYVEVPGIDVPFHSRELRAGVASFRDALDRHLPRVIDPALLVGRYVPNLVARPFALTREFVACVRDAVGGPSKAALEAVLADPDRHCPGELARLLLVELLAWQFASPVRWIETQELMFGPAGVEVLIEVGVGYQPTLANMARQTLAGDARVTVLNVEAERALVFAEDADPASAAPEAAPVHVEPARAEASALATTEVTATRPSDQPLTHAEALTTLIALQTKNRTDQIGPAETIDGLFDGVSSRRNQVLMDLGHEFDAGSIDRAHEVPLADLARELAQRAPSWRAPGAYLQGAHAEAHKRVLGRSGLGARDAAAYLEATYGFGPGLVAATFDTLALETRAGASARGGDLGALGDTAPATKDEARALLDRAVALLGKRRGTSYARLGAGPSAASTVVDARALAALDERLFAEGGAFFEAARAFAKACGKDLDGALGRDAAAPSDAERMAAIVRELGEDFLALVTPRFDSLRHVAFTSAWASAQRDLVRLALDALNHRRDAAQVGAELTRLRPHAAPRMAATARWFAAQAREAWLADALGAFAAATPTAPRFAGRVALVTGASPGSIAIEVTRELLAGGARVVVTTTQPSRERLAFMRRLYEDAAAPGAELHVVPCNQASFQDLDALVDWLFRAETEQAGAGVRVLKPAMAPDLLVPFAALKDEGTVDQLHGAAEATLRAMVLGTERLVGLVGRRLIASGEARSCHVLLPLSPNHGAFGGDGAYAESKAALEVLLAKWTSEREAWARQTTLAGARIGWVRGTGLMAQNDAVAPGLEARTGMRTWSSREMGAALAELLSDETRARAAAAPLVVDLSGGFATVPDLKAVVDEVRQAAIAAARRDKALASLREAEARRLAPKRPATTRVTPLPAWPAPAAPMPERLAWPAPVKAALDELVVIVGFGEVGPGGSARTRYELEVFDRLSAPAVLELAWLTGLIRWEASGKGGHWLDVAGQEVVPEGEIHARYHDLVRSRVGVRFIEPATVGFDAERTPVYEKVFLDRDFSFVVSSEAEARSFAASDPERTVVSPSGDGEAWRVTRKAGSELRVPREVRLTRRVAGQLPTGFSLARYGFPGEMLESVDPVALMNLAATVEAFVAAGTTPEELLQWVHPARVGTTQGSGMGGMKSLHRLYVDHLLGRERQTDVLQETLINVVFAYATSAYVGSYGPMAHPVAACATAALSLEDALDKIMLGKADVVMAGGWDDLSAEGVLGFGDMNATAETDKMLAMGLEPDQMSRANDRRRRGFVESQGGGALLLARGDVAAKMGLPVYGVLGFAASFGDGINRSIPAPGIGSLAAALGGKRSPLGRALERLGLSADDIALVSKHDTSTQANDPNESGIHQAIQDALGRTPGNPLMVVSQKTVLGHAKGGAAAWQTIGLCQLLAGGLVPGNRNLESLDPGHAAHEHLLYTSEPLAPGPALPLRAGLATSLGFGHVSALLLIVHPACFEHALPEAERDAWRERSAGRREAARRRWTEVLMGRAPLYDKRTDRRFAAEDASDAQRLEETAMLLDPSARFDPERGVFVRGGSA